MMKCAPHAVMFLHCVVQLYHVETCEDMDINSRVDTKPLHLILILHLHPPPYLLRKLRHLFLLLLTELGPKPLPPTAVSHVHSDPRYTTSTAAPPIATPSTATHVEQIHRATGSREISI